MSIRKTLGFGQDGHVFITHSNTAVKVLARPENFRLELACYERLNESGVTELGGFAVPRLRDFSEQLCVIEMSVVDPPFIVDFGKVHLDRRPDYSEEIMADWRADYSERWGNDWLKVRSLLYSLERYGIYYMDPKPGNIALPGWNPVD